MVKYAFSAIFTKEDNGQYSDVIKDLEGCYTCGDSVERAIEMAEDCWRWYRMGRKQREKKFRSLPNGKI